MIKTKRDFITKIHLLVSLAVVIPISIVYGFCPDSHFNIHLDTIDEHNAFKSIMGLYLGFSILWILGLFKKNYLKLALVSNMIFMLGLGFGRVLSFIIDGIPTFVYVLGTIGELVLGFYGFWLLTRYQSATNTQTHNNI